MKIKIEKNNNLYYMIIENIDHDINKCIIKKSWDSSFFDEIPLNSKTLYKNNIMLYNKEENIISIKLPEDEPKVYNDLYFIDIFQGETYQTIYVDYNSFHNINSDYKIYKHSFKTNHLKSSRNSLYKFYIEGNYGDIHQLELLYRINENECLLKVPNIEYESELYNIILEKNKNKISFEQFNMISKENIDFSCNKIDLGDYYKINLKPKYKYPFLVEYKITYNGKDYNNREYIYIKKNNISESTINIDYILKDSFVNSININGNFSYYIKEDIIKINPEYYYNYNNDSLTINFNQSTNLKYKLNIINETIYCDSRSITIDNFSKFKNNSPEISIDIFYSINNQYDEKYILTIPNYFNLDYINKFNPNIDYSKCLDVHNDGIITWTTPNCNYYSKIKIEVLNIKPILDEYMNVWSNEYILEKPVYEFDEKYTNYEDYIEYDFPRDDKVFLKQVKDTIISYDSTNNGFINIGKTNNFNLNLWFCEKGSKYKITIDIYDFWNKKVGSNSVEFSLYDNYIGSVSEDMLIFGRNQNIQFGETGTIGEFYKLNNPTPIQVMRSYSEKYKTFNGKALKNQLNIDFNNDSLYYYMNCNTDNYFFIKYMRNYNFYKLEYKLIDNSNNTMLYATNIPQGNNYDDNVIKIKRNLFKEGVNKLQIRTFNSEGIASEEKQFNFLVSNNVPDSPNVIINSCDYYTDDDSNIVINKKYFQLIVTNNYQSTKYAGWNFKEAHFFFKKPNSLYNEYPDYVVIASKEDGSIVLNNNTEIENGEYSCKVIAYDYFGNESKAFEFDFKLISEIVITPEALFTNKVDSKFIWNIKKSQDSEGFYYYLKYSEDGIYYINTEVKRIDSPYYVNNNSTSQTYELSINFLQDEYLKFKEGYYILVAYEHNLKHLTGLDEYKFESKPVEVFKTSNSSFPIYAKKTETNNVINPRNYNEYSYTNDINSIEFETIHNIDVFDNTETPEIEGQRYSIELISPNNNIYCADLPLPTEIGMYKFTNILDLAKVEDPIEGVWELRFITIDKYGNSNAYKGYYTYYIVYVNRNPKITFLNPNTSNGSNIFGLNSTSISYIVNTDDIYSDILNFEEHKDKFKINNFKLIMNYNPLGSTYSINLTSNDNLIEILNTLSENDKLTHIRDGKYSISISCVDQLNRESIYLDRIFYIDTQINGELLFLNNNVFNSRIIDLIAVCNGDVSSVIYTLDDNNDDINTWSRSSVGYIEHNGEYIYGINIQNLSFDEDGKKCIRYILEEESGNRSNIMNYYFTIDTDIKLIPIFDYTNKIYYLQSDNELNFSWYLTNEDVNKFYYKLDRVKMLDNGELEIVESYMPSSDGSLLPVGPGKNDFVNINSDRELIIPLLNNGWLITGYYSLTVKGFNIYGTSETNTFKFNINLDIPIDIEYEIINNKITLDNNIISWNHIKEANYYEISYDGFNWIKVIDNKFNVNSSSVIYENNKTYIYLRWLSYNGIYSNVSKIEIKLNITQLEKPIVNFYECKTITDNNKKLEWDIEIKDVPNAKYLYYSFDNEKWYSKKINNSIEKIINDDIEYPVKDGRYGIFVKTTDGDPLVDKYINNSEISYSYIDVFAEDIEKPKFSGISNGQTFNLPIRLVIENKNPKVQYFIYVNNMLVQEGYEIVSYYNSRYNINVKCKKNGIEKIYDILPITDEFHIYSKVDEKYSINIGNQKAVCYVDTENDCIIVNSTPNKRNTEIILYREKNSDNKWNILNVGDRLSLNYEWEFKITTFDTI